MVNKQELKEAKIVPLRLETILKMNHNTTKDKALAMTVADQAEIIFFGTDIVLQSLN